MSLFVPKYTFDDRHIVFHYQHDKRSAALVTVDINSMRAKMMGSKEDIDAEEYDSGEVYEFGDLLEGPHNIKSSHAIRFAGFHSRCSQKRHWCTFEQIMCVGGLKWRGSHACGDMIGLTLLSPSLLQLLQPFMLKASIAENGAASGAAQTAMHRSSQSSAPIAKSGAASGFAGNKDGAASGPADKENKENNKDGAADKEDTENKEGAASGAAAENSRGSGDASVDAFGDFEDYLSSEIAALVKEDDF